MRSPGFAPSCGTDADMADEYFLDDPVATDDDDDGDDDDDARSVSRPVTCGLGLSTHIASSIRQKLNEKFTRWI